MRVALAQINCAFGELESNLKTIERFVRQAVKQKADVVIFPELSDTAYGQNAVEAAATCWDDPNSSLQKLTHYAKRYAIHIIAGLAERTEGAIYNSLAVVSPDGNLLARYRKIHLFSTLPANEQEYTVAGSEVVSVELLSHTIGLSICYDLRFPELYRAQAVSGAEVLLTIAAWPSVRAEHWTCLARARAIENQSYFVAVNRCGSDDGIDLAGQSAVFDPNGELVCQADSTKEALLIAELDLARVEEVRSRIPSLYSRRTDVFK